MKKYSETDKRILRILVPVILENALLTLSTMVLSGYIGRLPVTAISAYGISRRIYSLYYSVFKGLAVGTMIAAARHFGKGEHKECARIQKTSYTVMLPLATLASVLIFIFAKPLLSFMTNDEDLLEEGIRLLRLTAPFYPLVAAVHVNAAAFQATGNTRTPMVIAATGNLVTMTFGYFLIFGTGSISGIGIFGAAVSQNFAFLIMASIGMVLLYGKHGLYKHEEEKALRLPALKEVKELLSVGLPASFEDSLWQMATILISSVILSYGQQYYAGFQLGLEAEGFCDMMSAGFMTAAMSMSANAIGAMDRKAYRTCFKRLHHFCLMISLITTSYLLFAAKPVLSLMTDKQELIVVAGSYLFLMIFSQYPAQMRQVAGGYLRSSGYTKTSMAVNLIGLWGVRVPLTLLCGMILKADITFVWWAFNIDQWIRLGLYMLSVHHYHLMDEPVKIKEKYA